MLKFSVSLAGAGQLVLQKRAYFRVQFVFIARLLVIPLDNLIHGGAAPLIIRPKGNNVNVNVIRQRLELMGPIHGKRWLTRTVDQKLL